MADNNTPNTKYQGNGQISGLMGKTVAYFIASLPVSAIGFAMRGSGNSAIKTTGTVLACAPVAAGIGGAVHGWMKAGKAKVDHEALVNQNQSLGEQNTMLKQTLSNVIQQPMHQGAVLETPELQKG